MSLRGHWGPAAPGAGLSCIPKPLPHCYGSCRARVINSVGWWLLGTPQAACSPRVPVGLSRWPVPLGDEDQAQNHQNHTIKPRERGLLLLLALLLQQSDPAGAGGLHSPDPWPDPAVHKQLGSWQGGFCSVRRRPQVLRLLLVADKWF